jgi:hypothetical protein
MGVQLGHSTQGNNLDLRRLRTGWQGDGLDLRHPKFEEAEEKCTMRNLTIFTLRQILLGW